MRKSESARDIRKDLNNQQQTSESHTNHVNDPNHGGNSWVGSICTCEPTLVGHLFATGVESD